MHTLHTKTAIPRQPKDWLIALGLLALTGLLYCRVLGQYWTADDPPILASIVTHGIWAHFTSPAAWAWHLPEPPMWGVFTPWVMLSMGLDWALGGLDPFVAYLHHLLALGLVMALLYLVLRRFFSRLAAGTACMLFLLTPPVHEAAHYLMERHYIEGLGLFLACMLCYERAVQATAARPSGDWRWAAASGLLYLAACSAKEIYAPLAALLPLLPWGTWRQRWVMLLPHAVAALLYLAWRAFMLSPDYMLGYGGGQVKLGLEQWLNVWRIGLSVNHMTTSWQRGVVTIFEVLVLCAMVRASGMAWLRALALVALTVLPLFPLLSMLQIRLYFLPVLVLAIGCAFVLDWLLELATRYRLTRADGMVVISHGQLAAALIALLAAPLAPAVISPHETTQRPMLARFGQEGRFALRANAQQALVHPIGWPIDFWWYFTSLATLRHAALHDDQSPAICYDPCFCSALAPRQAVRAMPGGLQPTLWPVSRDAGICGDRASPLTVHLAMDGRKGYPLLRWRLGPYGEDGYYALHLEDTEHKVAGQYYPVRPAGVHPVGHGQITVTVRWLSAAGWSTVSPPFVVAPGMQPVDWSRPLPSSFRQQPNDPQPLAPAAGPAAGPVSPSSPAMTSPGGKP